MPKKNIKRFAVCPKCDGRLTKAKKHVSKGYAFACLNCDEDFLNVEIKFNNIKD